MFHTHSHLSSLPLISNQYTQVLEIVSPAYHRTFTYAESHSLLFQICLCFSAWRRNLMSYLDKPSLFLKTSFKTVQGALSPGDICNKEKLYPCSSSCPQIWIWSHRQNSAWAGELCHRTKLGVQRWEGKRSGSQSVTAPDDHYSWWRPKLKTNNLELIKSRYENLKGS